MSQDAHHRAAQFAASLSTHDDVDGTLRRITDAVVRLLPDVDAASITRPRLEGGPPTLVAAAGELAELADAEQLRLAEGPALMTVERCERVLSSDLARDPRFPAYGAAAASVGVAAQAGLVLDVEALGCPALNLYSRTPGAFDDATTAGAWAFVEPLASAGLRYAHEIEHLRRALDTRTLIGQATGRVMERYGLAPDAAFALLSRLSSTRNVKLHALAREVVAESGRRPDDTADGARASSKPDDGTPVADAPRE